MLLIWCSPLLFFTFFHHTFAEWNLFLPIVGQGNSYEQMKFRVARYANVSNCWVCAQLPQHTSGLPFRPFAWNVSDLCYYSLYLMPRNGLVAPQFSHEGNCSSMVQYSLLQTFTRYAFSFDPNKPPAPVLVRPMRGFLCYHSKRTDKTTWYAGKSSCQYYVTSDGPNISLSLGNITVSTYFTDRQQFSWLTGVSNYLLPSYADCWWICGPYAYRWLHEGWYGTCYIGFLLPPVRILSELPPTRPKRNTPLISEGERFAMILLPSYGVGKLIQIIKKLSTLIETMGNETTAVTQSLSLELRQTRIVALQNRMALDYLLAAQGGTCAIIGQECCTYIPDSFSDQQAHITSLDKALQNWEQFKVEDKGWFDWLTAWMPNISWVKGLLGVLIGLAFVFLIVCCSLSCIIGIGKTCLQKVTPNLTLIQRTSHA
uniref:Syncytin-1-like isoform X2 n=1 Tax=Geotrypetes seraphini TaxID=260995 RepID=A0A6P8NXI9_GEOSA|nr:syncytin-1-like isoform X2 [Geotrypetes seraphini]XP_033775849.1 syncytin-1-like isoform X2 [Geotrypetes seraphini]